MEKKKKNNKEKKWEIEISFKIFNYGSLVLFLICMKNTKSPMFKFLIIFIIFNIVSWFP